MDQSDDVPTVRQQGSAWTAPQIQLGSTELSWSGRAQQDLSAEDIESITDFCLHHAQRWGEEDERAHREFAINPFAKAFLGGVPRAVFSSSYARGRRAAWGPARAARSVEPEGRGHEHGICLR